MLKTRNNMLKPCFHMCSHVYFVSHVNFFRKGWARGRRPTCPTCMAATKCNQYITCMITAMLSVRSTVGKV
jgi:hypothetical protein